MAVETVLSRDPDDLASRAVGLILKSASEATSTRGRFTLALSGGSTPERTYALLARPENAGQLDWARVWLLLGDERFVPFDDPRSNFGLAQRTLIRHVPIPPGNVFPIATFRASADDAAASYADTLSHLLSPGPGQPPVIDFVLLGLGDDGHTASLFPGKPALHVTDRWAVSTPPGVLPPPVERVTLTYPVLNAARHVAFLVAGAGKAAVVREILEGRPDPERYPAAGVKPTQGRLTWLLDEQAGRSLTRK